MPAGSGCASWCSTCRSSTTSRVSGSLEDRVTEFVDHLHEHFVDPCIVENGAYVLPSAAGYSAQMHEASVAEYTFPGGAYWSSR